MSATPEQRRRWMELDSAMRQAWDKVYKTDAYKAAKKAEEAHGEFEGDIPEEHYADCEFCGVPLFTGDQVLSYEDGVTTCCLDGNPTGETGPCYGKEAGVKKAI